MFPLADSNEEAEVDDDIAVPTDESEAGLSVTTKGSKRSDPTTKWTAQSSEAQPDIHPERFGKWVKTPVGKASEGGPGDDRATGGIPQHVDLGITQTPGGHHPRGTRPRGTPLGTGGTTPTL